MQTYIYEVTVDVDVTNSFDMHVFAKDSVEARQKSWKLLKKRARENNAPVNKLRIDSAKRMDFSVYDYSKEHIINEAKMNEQELRSINNQGQRLSEVLYWGLDLTDFGSAERFREIINKFGITKHKKMDSGYNTDIFVWYNNNKSLMMGTEHNPITGETGWYPKARREKGFAGYIAIKGEPRMVKALVNDIKNKADLVKDESPRDWDFIAIPGEPLSGE